MDNKGYFCFLLCVRVFVNFMFRFPGIMSTATLETLHMAESITGASFDSVNSTPDTIRSTSTTLPPEDSLLYSGPVQTDDLG